MTKTDPPNCTALNRQEVSLEDSDVVRRVLAGDANAFEYLIKKYQSHVLRVVCGKIPREAELEVGQDTFVRAFTSLGSYDTGRSFKYWLTGIAVRSCYDYWRARKWHREVPQSSLSEAEQYWLESRAGCDGAPSATNNEVRLLEDRQVLDWAMGQLHPKDRLALILTHMEGYTVAEAADVLGWSQTNVKVRSFRARKKLREVIDKAINGAECK